MEMETQCPECSGAGFFGGNGPRVDVLCGKCKGTGVLIDGQPYRHVDKPEFVRRPMSRADAIDAFERSQEKYREGRFGNF